MTHSNSATRPAIPRTIWALGFVSLLTDMSSEMVHGLLPLLLVGGLGASALMVGVIEGFRWVLLGTEQPDLQAMAISALFITVFLLGGLVYFRRMERSFADII